MPKKVINENILRQLIRNILHEAVDELNLYHGTHADFDKFDVAYLSTGWGQQAHGYGFYLTDCYEAAKDYSCGGKVMEVKVPDGKYLSDKRISPREKQVIARTFFKYYTEELDYGKEAYPDAQARNDFWQYEVSCILNCDDGAYVYGTVASLLGSNEDTSNFLHDKLGYVGITIHTKHGETGEPITTYVIFNPNDIEILNKDVVNEKVDKLKVDEFHKIFTFGKYNGQEKTKVIREDPEYCVWLYKKMKYSPFTDKQLGLLDVSYYRKYKMFPIKSRTTPNYAQIKGVLVKNMTAEQLSYVYENGTDEFKWLVKQEHTNRGWHYHPYKRYPVFQTDDLYENIDKRQPNEIDKYDNPLGKFGTFKLSPAILSCIYEAAFQLLGYERFAIDGEMVMDNKVMDNPWDDAYHILKWAIDNKGLDEKYLGRVSSLYSDMDDNQFHNYIKQVESGKIFWFSREELSEIFKVLPDVLRKHLVQDMLNVGRTGKIRATVEQLKRLNGGENLERFIEIIRRELKSGNVKRGIANFKELVRQTMQTTLMLGSGK